MIFVQTPSVFVAGSKKIYSTGVNSSVFAESRKKVVRMKRKRIKNNGTREKKIYVIKVAEHIVEDATVVIQRTFV